MDPSVTSPLCAAKAASTWLFSSSGTPKKSSDRASSPATASNSSDAISELPMGLLEAERIVARLGPDVLEGPAGDLADPQRAHELQARQAGQLLGVPLAQLGVVRTLPGDLVPDDRVAEMVHDRGDREDAAEALVQALLAHVDRPLSSRSPSGLPSRSDSNTSID